LDVNPWPGTPEKPTIARVTSEVMSLTGLAGAAMAVRYVTQLIIVLWSLRADEAGRKHAIRLLELLRSKRAQRRRSP
jgi:hypothetical protein